MPDRPDSIQDNVPIAPYTTFKIGGPARYLAVIKTIADLEGVLSWSRTNAVPFRVLGKGANVLVSDRGYDGLIIVMQNDQLEWQPPRVVAGAGVQNGQLIANALRHNLGGMRWLIGVPGTVGGSLYGNAGGHGWGLGDQVEWVEVLTTGELRRLTQAECAFTYRSSAFKMHPEWTIVRTQLVFPTVDPKAERDLLAATTKEKNANQPTTTQTAGCMFTNPKVDATKLPDDLRQFVGADGTLSAWRAIDYVGLKGERLGAVEISSKHANFMINLGGATADHVVQLLSLVKQRVRDTLGVQLHEEVQYLGF